MEILNRRQTFFRSKKKPKITAYFSSYLVYLQKMIVCVIGHPIGVLKQSLGMSWRCNLSTNLTYSMKLLYFSVVLLEFFLWAFALSELFVFYYYKKKNCVCLFVSFALNFWELLVLFAEKNWKNAKLWPKFSNAIKPNKLEKIE